MYTSILAREWRDFVISRLSGKLVDRDLTEITVEANGVGYGLTVPLSTFDSLPAAGESVSLYVHTHVRDDAIILFGFATVEERKLFRLLQTVSGIGNRLALNILSSMSANMFADHIVNGNIAALSKISGLGKKSAERLAVELREGIRDVVPEAGLEQDVSATGALSAAGHDAMAALQTLGFKSEQARKTIEEICRALPAEEHTSENLIRKALSRLNT